MEKEPCWCYSCFSQEDKGLKEEVIKENKSTIERDHMNFRDYLTIKEAAIFIGVAPNTLRNWEKEKRIPTYKAPYNKRRLYKREDLQAYLNNINQQ